MGAGCCKAADELNPDNTPKDPQTKEQQREDGKELRRLALAADWAQMRVLLRRMPLRQIRSGADKKEANEEDIGNTALHYAVSINHLRGIKKLLRYGIPPHVVNAAGKTPLHLALETGKLKASRILLEKSVALQSGQAAGSKPPPCLIDLKDAKGVTPLLAVAAAGRLKLAREVVALCKELDVRIDFDVVDKEGNSLLLYAAKWGWFDQLEAWLKEVRVPAKLLNIQTKEGETVLGHVLMFRASGMLDKTRGLEIASRLTELGALVKLPAFKERVPLINLAVAADDKDLYSVLVSKGSDALKARDVLGRTPLHYAAAKGARTMAAEMLDIGLKAYATDSQGNTPLHLAAMRGHEALVALLLERADDKFKALLTPNKSGLTAYHLALKAGPDERAQRSSLALIEQLGERFTTPAIGSKKKVVDTPLLLAIQGHQDKVVRAMLQKGLSPNERNAAGELPLARVLRCATAVTYDNDSDIFDQLMASGADMSAASSTAHPLLALCKNNLSKFAEKVVGVLKERSGGRLDWDKRDEKGYTPLSLAAYYDNAWLVRYLIDEEKIDPNSEAQRSARTEPEVVGTTGGMCSAKPIHAPGTVAGQTPLMCAAKGASLTSAQLLLNRGADVHAVDAEGRTALQHAMNLDKIASLQVAAALLRMGAHPGRGTQPAANAGAGASEQWRPCIDLVGEYWPHRAVRYGVSSFLKLWVECGGPLDTLLATTADDADDMPGAELKVEEKSDFLDLVPSRVENAVEAEDEELVDEYNGEDSEKAPADEDKEGDGSSDGARPVGEGVEATAADDARLRQRHGSGSSSEDDCGEDLDEELAGLLSSGQAESYYPGPTPRMMLRWRRRGMQWWDDFWVDRDSLPDAEMEDDPNWEDKYNLCEEGEEWIDEEDVEEEIWERVRKEQRAAAIALRRARAEQEQQEQQQQQQEQQQQQKINPRPAASPNDDHQPLLVVPEEEVAVTETLISRVSSGLAHKLFRHRLPNAAVPLVDNEVSASVDTSRKLAAGSPSQWLRRRSSFSGSSIGTVPPAVSLKASSATSATSARNLSLGGSSMAGRLSAVDPAALAAEADALRQERRPGPVAEGREDLAVMDVEDLSPVANRQQDPPGRRSLRFQPSRGGAAATAESTQTEQEPAVLLLGSDGNAQLLSRRPSRAASTKSTKSSAVEATVAAEADMPLSVMKASASLGKSMNSVAGKLTSGMNVDRLYANEEYYRPETLYDGLPRYMKLPTDKHPKSKYVKYVTDLEARVKAYDIRDDKRLEGADLRARNIAWYHKSMSPAEYPLKPGKWKSFQRMSVKAVEQAKQRRPRKPGEKPQIRKKKVWFGIPPMPSRPELAMTSPLVYAVRLGRVKCVEALLQYGTTLPDIPDAHGVTPLSYALYMLIKDRQNKALQQMVDLLLAARPEVDTATLWRTYLRPRMEDKLNALQKVVDEQGGEKALSKPDRQTLKDLRTTVSLLQQQGQVPGRLQQPAGQQGQQKLPEPQPDYAKLFPTIMDPLILTTLLNDVGRTTYLVKELGAGLNQTWVWLADIPTYVQGLLETQVGRCHSRCSPIHLAVCLKQYETVRALLDLGADPNLCGEEFSGDFVRDEKRKAKIQKDNLERMQEDKERGAKSNPYVKLWSAPSSGGLKQLLLGVKRFISNIEIPGRTRPNPWVSPLHLSCRFGLADISFLLLKRGAAANGADAAKYARKSPLEEALMYARANAQAYGTESERRNYSYIKEEACLEYSDRMRGQISTALDEQGVKHAASVKLITDLVDSLAASGQGAKGKTGSAAASAMRLMIRGLTGGSLGAFDPNSLQYVPVPGMNAAVLESKASKMYKDALAMMDPVKGAIKAVTLAAKVIVRALLYMMKRPIAHCDPALACAHVMLYFRAPINVAEKQTGILVRDILDNGNGVSNGEDQDLQLRRSYYRWLGIEPSAVQDDVWVQSAINRITVLKSNVTYGYMAMDTATDFKAYDKAKKKFWSEVEATILNLGAGSVMPHYMKTAIQEVLEAHDKATAKNRAAGTLEAELDKLLDVYIKMTADKEKQGPGEATREEQDSAARRLLPDWVFAAPAGGGGDTPVVLTPASSSQEVKTYIIGRFIRFTAKGATPKTYQHPPVDLNLGARMLESKQIILEPPAIPQEAIDAAQPTQDDLPDADVCTAVLRAYNALVAQRISNVKQALLTLRTNRATAAGIKRRLLRLGQQSRVLVSVQTSKAQLARHLKEQSAGVTTNASSGQSRNAQATAVGLLAFDEGPIFEAAIENPMWEAAISLLGCGPSMRRVMTRLRTAQGRDGVPRISDPLALVKGLGNSPGTLDAGTLLAGIESQLGTSISPKLRAEMMMTAPQGSFGETSAAAGVLSSGSGPSKRFTAGDPDARIDGVSNAATQLAETAQSAGIEGLLAIVESKAGPRVEIMTGALRQLAADGAFPRIDPEVLLNDLVQQIGQRGSEAVVSVWERSLGRVLPEDIRAQVEQGAEDFAAQVTQMYEDGSLTPGAIIDAAAAAIGSTAGDIADMAEAGADRVASMASEIAEGNLSCLVDENGSFVLPHPKKLTEGPMGQVVAGALGSVPPSGEQLITELETVAADGLAELKKGQEALEDAFMNNDFSSLCDLGSARLKAPLATELVDSLKGLIERLRQALVAEDGDVAAAAAEAFSALVEEAQAAVKEAAQAVGDLAKGVAAFASGEGSEALAQALSVDNDALAGVLESSTDALDGGAEAMEAMMLRKLVNPQVKAMVKDLIEDQAPEGLLSDIFAQLSQIEMSANDFLDGVEMALGMDVASLMESLDEARETLLAMLETLNIDEAF